MIKQHPTAVISPKAQLGENVEVAPFAYIEDDVLISDNSYIGPHACIYNGARIGKNVRIFQSASISHRPQDLKYADQPTEAFIGDNTLIHECATVHRGTDATLKTIVGANVLLMAYSHVAHDCRVGDNVILANSVQLAGHVHIDSCTTLGGGVLVHQFTQVGGYCMVGGGYRVSQDLPPYLLAAGEPLRYEGLNVIGLRRRGFTGHQVDLLKRVYNVLYSKSHNVSQAREIIERDFAGDSLVETVLEFLRRSKRGIAGK
jgi:UDP-N-acetylglucosamine acyltransferase